MPDPATSAVVPIIPHELRTGIMPGPSGSAQQPEARPDRFLRQVIIALKASSNDATGLFRQGHSDKTVAADIGCSEAYVVSTRERLYGVLKPPSEIAAIKAEIEAANRMHTAALKKMAEDLDALVAGLQARLRTLAEKNGWKS